MKQFNTKIFLSYFIPLFVVLYILSGSVVYYLYYQQKKINLNEIKTYYTNIIEQQKELLFSTIYPSISDMFYLTHKKNIRDYLTNPQNNRIAVEDLELFARSNLDYKQVRYIDSNGMERIRINWINDSIVLVPGRDLQNKKNRYYFRETMKMSENEIYISPIDLNMENGMVEEPHETVIRFGSPVLDKKGKTAGIIVINQYLNNFFNELKNVLKDKACEQYLLNSEGYFLLAPDRFKTFGFMFNDFKDETFGKYYPETWSHISDSIKGIRVNRGDFFFYNNASIFDRYKILNNKNLNSLVNDTDNQWHFLIHVKYTDINSIKYLTKLFIISLIILFPVLIVLAFFISRARLKEILLIRELKDLNQELEHKVEVRTRQLTSKNNALISVNEELEAFSYSVSHDLRAPLRHIIGFIDLAFKTNKDELNEKGHYYLNIVKDAATEMRKLIDDLLRLSRVGRNQLNLTEVDLNQVIDEIKPIVTEDFKDHSVSWVVDQLPLLKCDYALMRQVMINLMHNAVKYSQNKKKSLIKIRAIPENQSITIFVKDNGIGFDMDYSQKLFGTFQRLHDKEEFEGSGIGLAIVKRIITRHGGKVWAESNPGNGATFYFNLPQDIKIQVKESPAD
ncbi:ATP-binding protein [Saccharicrinis sp. FJH54]|uniref:sensor histidine kinase n=1 Tax=Saccharicrinis sp. FJH54 TaxID=3344665 RepID=UPI0035D3EC28